MCILQCGVCASSNLLILAASSPSLISLSGELFVQQGLGWMGCQFLFDRCKGLEIEIEHITVLIPPAFTIFYNIF